MSLQVKQLKSKKSLEIQDWLKYSILENSKPEKSNLYQIILEFGELLSL